MAGLEPATPRLEVWCAIHCATRAYNERYIRSLYINISIFLYILLILHTIYMIDTCSICLDTEFIDTDTHDKRKYVTKCNHIYHYDCIHLWANRNNSCPACRTPDLIDGIVNEPADAYGDDDDVYIQHFHNYIDLPLYIASIRNARTNTDTATFIDINDYYYDDFDYDVYMETLNGIYSTNLINTADAARNVIYNLPVVNQEPQQINLQMPLNNTRPARTNHRLGNMNYRTF
jgi:hypothetical protein